MTTTTWSRTAHADRRLGAALGRPPPPPVPPDPDGEGWWDDTLTPEETARRLEGLDAAIDHAEAHGAPPCWVVSERLVLAGLCRRARQPARRKALPRDERDARIVRMDRSMMMGKDIAAALGVSPATVSRVLRAHREGGG